MSDNHDKNTLVIDDNNNVVNILNFEEYNEISKKKGSAPINPGERIISYNDPDAQPYFDNINLINVILTNACNLSCSYCFEQHRKDYGKWTVEKVKQVYDFLKQRSNFKKVKILQFFGGEPLIHKKLILSFLKKYDEELSDNYPYMEIGLVTNGLLLDEAFIKEYLSYPFTKILISLDTFDINRDHRNLKQHQMDRIINNIKLARSYANPENPKAVTIRCTISKDNYDTLPHFAETLYEYGVRAMTIHPLTMSNQDGFIEWTDEEWNTLRNSLLHIILGTEIRVEFAEGVGTKNDSSSNCAVGSEMLAIDASGDKAGCYFFTNLKDIATPFILGNLFEDKLYIERYRHFEEQYRNLLGDKDEQCKTCDVEGYCYQCPAGNIGTGNKQMFRSDSMCKKIANLYLEIKNEMINQRFNAKLDAVLKAFTEATPEEINKMISKSLQYLVYRKEHGWYPTYDKNFKVDTELSHLKAGLGLIKDKRPDLEEATLFDLCSIINPNSVKDWVDDLDHNDIEITGFLLTMLHYI